MRLSFLCLALASLSVAACSVETIETSPSPYRGGSGGYDEPAAAPPVSNDRPTLATPTTGTPEQDFSEEVYVFMRDTINRRWFCTGTLVAERTVVTAAHCLDTTKFKSFEIVAPRAKNQPRVKGLQPASFSTAFEDVANPDIGVLMLEESVAIAHYAVLTDVGPRIDAGEALLAGAVTRTDELPEAPLQESEPLPVTSAVEFGYEHGFATPLFTKGGDSGSGLFLVEDGKLTHKLIGVARQPDPARNIDHFSRIDAPFLSWFSEHSGIDDGAPR